MSARTSIEPGRRARGFLPLPVNESKRKIRDRWPLEFDLAGVPRDTAERARLIKQKRELEAAPIQEFSPMPKTVQNNFAVDYQNENVIDINNPPQKGRYQHQEFPKMVYNHDTGKVLVVQNAAEEKVSQKRGFVDKPANHRDYTKVANGTVAPLKPEGEQREPEITAEDLAALDEQEAAALAEQAAQEAEEEPAQQRRNRRG